jgi:hypothetical protein
MGLYRPQESFQPRESAMNLAIKLVSRCPLALDKLNRGLDTKSSPLFQLPRIHQLKPLRAYSSPIVHISNISNWGLKATIPHPVRFTKIAPGKTQSTHT